MTPIPPIPDLHEQIKRWLWKQNFTCSRTLDVADVADWIEKYTDERIAKLTAEVEQLKLKAFEWETAYHLQKNENTRLKAPVSDEEYECMFIALNAVNKEPGKPMRGMDVFNAVIASRATRTPQADKEEK